MSGKFQLPGVNIKMMKYCVLCIGLIAISFIFADYDFIAVKSAYADADEHELEQILEQVKNGEILPLERILRAVYAQYDGEVISVELDREDGMIVYEIKLITTGGRLLEVYLNAKTAEIIKVENET